MGKSTTTNGHNKITRGQVMKDMVYFYKHILMDYKEVLGPIGILNQIGMASRVVLDAKYFIKEYHYIRDTSAKTFHLDRGEKLGIFCMIARKCHHNNEIKMSPQECIVVNKNATLSEVYGEAERVFREIYWELRDVVVESIVDGQREITRFDEIALNGKKGLVLEGNVGMMMNIEVMKCYDDDNKKKKEKRIECGVEQRKKMERGWCVVIFVKYGNTQDVLVFNTMRKFLVFFFVKVVTNILFLSLFYLEIIHVIKP